MRTRIANQSSTCYGCSRATPKARSMLLLRAAALCVCAHHAACSRASSTTFERYAGDNCADCMMRHPVDLRKSARSVGPAGPPVNDASGQPTLPPTGPDSQPTSTAQHSNGSSAAEAEHACSIATVVVQPTVDCLRPALADGRYACRAPVANLTLRSTMRDAAPVARQHCFRT
uniref:Uncharacterized protein n=1 Tax=Coccolithus braarudii TaxID=221442 RepID=A0A7S0Q4N6_9EUKA|mmetsp:Transcript_34189/g.72998  ORF Transcript_34189/g.72998 Transcript_34189/m.72998 type:complete len:173 (+) Transcript_34189:370-888(+)